LVKLGLAKYLEPRSSIAPPAFKTEGGTEEMEKPLKLNEQDQKKGVLFFLILKWLPERIKLTGTKHGGQDRSKICKIKTPSFPPIIFQPDLSLICLEIP